MAIDFFYEGDERHTAQPRFSLQFSSYEKLDEVWSAIEQQTGVFVDPYGSTILERRQIELLVSLMDKLFKVRRPDENAAQLLRFLKAELAKGANALYLEGD